MNEIPYWGVVSIPFLKLGQFTVEKRNEAIEWCNANCEDKRITSDLRPWAFLSEKDARAFADKFGGTVVFKDKDYERTH